MYNCDETIISHAQITAARDAAARTLYNYPNLLLYILDIFKEKNFRAFCLFSRERHASLSIGCEVSGQRGDCGLRRAALREGFTLPTFQPPRSP